jgi:hypothetical protein
MGEIGAEALLAAQTPSERLEHAQRDLLLGSAAAAYEVAMSFDVRAMPARHAIVQMGVGDVAELLKRFKIPIHRRRVDLRVGRADRAGYLIRGGVVPGPADGVQHETPLDGQALALGPEVGRHIHSYQRRAIACPWQ